MTIFFLHYFAVLFYICTRLLHSSYSVLSVLHQLPKLLECGAILTNHCNHATISVATTMFPQFFNFISQHKKREECMMASSCHQKRVHIKRNFFHGFGNPGGITSTKN